jgi:hypothetical protein
MALGSFSGSLRKYVCQVLRPWACKRVTACKPGTAGQSIIALLHTCTIEEVQPLQAADEHDWPADQLHMCPVIGLLHLHAAV